MGFQLDQRMVTRMINAPVSGRVSHEVFTVQVRGNGRAESDWLALELVHYEQDAWAIGVIDPDDPEGDTAAVLYVRRGFDKAWGVYAGNELLGESESLQQTMTLAVTLVTAPWSEG